MNKKKVIYPIVIHDVLLLLSIIFSMLFFSFYTIFPHFDIDATAIKVTLASLTFLAFVSSFGAYLFIEYRYNRLSFKNIFFYLAAIIVVVNIIAVSCLPSKINLPNEGLMLIPALDRIYYLLSGIALAALIPIVFYLIPRRVNNRYYVNIILILLVLITAICIIVSFFTDFEAYKQIFSSHFKDIDIGITSMFGVKNIFARVVLTGIIAATLLHFRTKNWKWILVVIPFIFFLVLSSGKMSILLGALYLLIYLIIHLVLIAKKSKDNLVIVSLICGFIVLMSAYIGTMIGVSTGGPLFLIKEKILNAIDNMKITFESRRMIWECSFQILAPYQYVFGYGVAAFGVALNLTYTPTTTWDFNIYTAHNAGIELIGRGGVLMLLMYLFLYVYLFYLSIKIYKKKPLYISIMMLIMIGYIIHSAVETYYVCDGFGMTTTLLITVPIISEYYICYKKESEMKNDIVKCANALKKTKFNSKLLNLNKKCLLIEAKHIVHDLRN